jgi:23S rRNA pseudoU1915 N3-methylase RlmH
MAIELTEILTSMLNIAKANLKKYWAEAGPYAEMEFKKIALSIVTIEKMKLEGTITEEQARLHLDIQKNSARAVLLTIEGLGIIAVERTINAALAAVKEVVNKAIGWPLL